jgi:hypothetical protein
MLLKSLFAVLISAGAMHMVSAEIVCTCPPTDLNGEANTAQSGGTRGEPLFCGYQPFQTIKCFYGYVRSSFSVFHFRIKH